MKTPSDKGLGAASEPIASAALAAAPRRGTSVPNGADNFYTSDKVTVQNVSVKNQYQTSFFDKYLVRASA